MLSLLPSPPLAFPVPADTLVGSRPPSWLQSALSSGSLLPKVFANVLKEVESVYQPISLTFANTLGSNDPELKAVCSQLGGLDPTNVSAGTGNASGGDGNNDNIPPNPADQPEDPEAEMARILQDEHETTGSEFIANAVKGATSVKGAGGEGADVVLSNGGEREVTVHTGNVRNFGTHLQDEARQFSASASPKEIWIQIKNAGITQEQLVNDIAGPAPNWQYGTAGLDGIDVIVRGPNNENWWSGTFGPITGGN